MAQAEVNVLEVLQAKQGCYACLSPSEIKQIRLWMLSKVFEAAGGELQPVATMTQDAACLACEPDSVLDIFELVIWQLVASSLGATVDGTSVGDLTVAELKEATKCYPCADPKLVRAAYIYALYWAMGKIVQSMNPT